jgi:hypothetical protein
MNTYYSGRSSRPAGLFSFSLLDGPQGIAVSRNGRLTISRRAQTWRALFIAPCALREAHGKGRVLARLGRAGARTGFDLSRFATAFMNNPG